MTTSPAPGRQRGRAVKPAPTRWHPSRKSAEQLIKVLERVCTISGHRPHQVFEDWVAICEATLTELPLHVERAAKTGQLRADEEDSEATKEVWKRCRTRYRDRWKDVANIFAEAFHMLLDIAHWEMKDILGEVFHKWELSNHWKGQYFTPWVVASMMAQMVNPAQQVYANLKEALLHPDNILGQTLLIGALVFDAADEEEPPTEGPQREDSDTEWALDGEEWQPFQRRRRAHSPRERYLVEQLIPAALPYYEPVKLLEPCIGSGVMVLAAAASVPWWMNHYALIQYSGADIDPLCVAMARTQCMLYGLNGYAIKLELGLSGADWTAIREREERAAAEAEAEAAAAAQAAAEEAAPLYAGDPGLHEVLRPVEGATPPRRQGKATGIKKTAEGYVVEHEQLDLFAE